MWNISFESHDDLLVMSYYETIVYVNIKNITSILSH